MNRTLAYVAVTLVLLLHASSRAQTASGVADATSAKPKQQDAAENYLRVLRNARGEPIAMQTSILSFRPRGNQSKVVVDLIGAVHVADRAYYRTLSKEFQKYDAMLYELVAPEHSAVPQNGESQHPVGQMQQGMKSMLELSFQLEEINYAKKNFVHADMSPNELAKVMEERGDSFLQTMLRMMGSALAIQGGKGRSTDSELLFALFAKDRALRLKRVMSEQLRDFGGVVTAIEGSHGTTLIGQRNKKALDVLRRELAKGKQHVAIFYGAAHMPDMEERLKRDFGLHPDPKSLRWLTAWDMQGKK